MTTKTMRKKTTPALALKLGKVVKTSTIEMKRPKSRGSQYDEIFDQMEGLRAGQSFTVDIPRGVEPRTMHNRINAAVRRVELEPPKGCIFVKRTTEDGRIAISCAKR